jgi:hypothetical protein
MLHPAENRDAAAALPDDAVHNGEAQAGTLPLLFGGEKRFEYAALLRLVHPTAVVGYAQKHVRPGKIVFLPLSAAGIKFDGRDLNDEFAALRHRIAGVDGQIDEDLLQLCRIGFRYFGSTSVAWFPASS